MAHNAPAHATIDILASARQHGGAVQQVPAPVDDARGGELQNTQLGREGRGGKEKGTDRPMYFELIEHKLVNSFYRLPKAEGWREVLEKHKDWSSLVWADKQSLDSHFYPQRNHNQDKVRKPWYENETVLFRK